ncbi:hypothetical protein [Micromonospora chersina]|uniref:hypothetical protein n=1 Tax=Micromonospora chersina TaxID=47854 RepID=UPI00371C8E66
MVDKDPRRVMTGRIGGYTSWSRTIDRAARTAPARQAALDRFERQVDPDGTLSPDVRAQLAQAARSAYMARLAYLSAEARRANRQQRDAAPKGRRATPPKDEAA